MIAELFNNLLSLTLDAAPWLLLGLLAAGLIKAWVPDSVISRWLGGSGPWPVMKAAVIGAPLPLCSCGVLPAALGLRRSGASQGSTVSFMVATPETGVDSVAISYALLGPFMAVVRPVAAIVSAIVAGLLASLVKEPVKKSSPFAIKVVSSSSSSCCDGGSCCSSEKAEESNNVWQRSMQGLRYALTDILDDIALWLFVGLLAAAVLTTFVPPMALAQWGSGLPAMVLMLLIGIPMYICATASTPLAAGLLLAGVSPGTVLVFLLAGPATNIATLAVLRKEMGSRVLVAYLAGVAVSAIALGLLTDRLVEVLAIDIGAQLHSAETLTPDWFAAACAVLLVLFALKPLRRKFLR